MLWQGWILEIGLFILTGGAAGILSGLLGVGGGVIVIPALMVVFFLTPIPHDLWMHVAEGTSLAAMIFTTLAAGIAHYRQNNIDRWVWKSLLPSSVVGIFWGGGLASALNGRVLAIIFGLMLILIALHILFFSKKTGEGPTHFPGVFGMNVAGLIVGFSSGLLGIGGGALMIPFFIACNLKMSKASGTSAAIIFPLAIIGAGIFMLTGKGLSLPYSTGYIYWPAFAGVVLGGVIAAPLGAKWCQKVNQAVLKKIFAIFLIGIAINLLS